MPVAALLFCLCCMHSYAQPSVDKEEQNETNEMDIFMSSVMADVVSELNKAGIDYMNLTKEYNKICPSRLKRCKNCSCDVACWERQNCCPNCPHAFLKRGCVNIAVMGNPINVMMIDDCPHLFEGDVEIEELCSLNTSEVAPVSYMTLDFKNKYCALCHGINVYESWKVVVTCEQPIPVDPILLDNTLEETLSNYNCKVGLEHPNSTNRIVPCNLVSRLSQLDRCNVTGLWRVYDKGLSWACETLNSLPSFGVFKNVYCYLCNPSLASTIDRPQVKSCISNKTCSSESGFSERLSPYGSVCMMECNDIGKVVKLDATVDDNVTVTTNETVNHETGQSKVEIQLLVSDPDQILTTVKPYLVSIYGDTFRNWTANRNHGELPKKSVNEASLQEQIKTYYAICGEQIMCDRAMLPYTTAYYGGTSASLIVTLGDTYRFNCINYGNQYECHDLSNIMHYECTFESKTFHLATVSTNPVCGSCSCSPNCLLYDTCCVDLLLKQQPFSCYSEADFPTFYPADSKVNLPIDKVQADDKNINSYSVVSNCLGDSPLYYNMCTGTDNNTDMLSHIPITAGEVIYKNIYCMLCNQERWTFNTVIDIELNCNSYLEAALFPDLQTTLSVAQTKCKTLFKPKRVRPCKKKTYSISHQFYATDDTSSFSTSDFKVIDKCNETGMWTENILPIRQLCEDDSATSMYLPEYRIDLKVYKNFACFECNPEVSLTREDDGGAIASCEGNTTVENNPMLELCLYHPTHARWFPYKNFYCAQCNQPPLILFQLSLYLVTDPRHTETYTYRNLFRLGPGKLTSDSADDTICEGIYDKEKKICRVLQCGEERKLVNNSCVKKGATYSYVQLSVSSLPDVTYQLRFKVTPDGRNTVDDKDTVSLETLCIDLISSLFKNFYLVSFSCQVYNVSCETTNVTVEHLPDLVLSYIIVYNISDEIDEPIKDVVPTLVDSLSRLYTIESDSGQVLLLRASPIMKEYEFPSNISACTFDDMYEEYSRSNVTVYVDKFLNCPHVRFDASEVHVDADNGFLTLHHDGSSFKKKDYKLSKGIFIICKKDYNSSKRRETYKTSPFTRAYTLFNRICILLSLLCLLFTFVTFCIFKTLRNIPGKNIMTLTLTLFIAHILILIAPFMDLHTNALSCTVFGAVIHYFWLAIFSAMCVCSFHMFKLFYIGHLLQPNQGRSYSYIVVKYNAFVFGLPFFIITLVIICHLFTTDGLFSGYTRNNFEMCFLSGFNATLFGFILPIALLNVASIILFSMSFHKIRTSPRMRGKKDRRDVIICIKLCAIVGITWPLQIVDAAVNMSVFSFVVVCFNAFQGVFIFISYICNARVLRMYNILFERNSPSLTTIDTLSSRPASICTDAV